MQKPVPVIFEEIRMECGYWADLVVERRVMVDTKAIVKERDQKST